MPSREEERRRALAPHEVHEERVTQRAAAGAGRVGEQPERHHVARLTRRDVARLLEERAGERLPPRARIGIILDEARETFLRLR